MACVGHVFAVIDFVRGQPLVGQLAYLSVNVQSGCVSCDHCIARIICKRVTFEPQCKCLLNTHTLTHTLIECETTTLIYCNRIDRYVLVYIKFISESCSPWLLACKQTMKCGLYFAIDIDIALNMATDNVVGHLPIVSCRRVL